MAIACQTLPKGAFEKTRKKSRCVEMMLRNDNDGMDGAEAAIIANGFDPKFGYGEDRALNAGPLTF
jgi:hypothetical protein